MTADPRCPECDARVFECVTPAMREPILLDVKLTTTGLYQIVHEGREQIARAVDHRKHRHLPAARRPALFDLHNCDPGPRRF